MIPELVSKFIFCAYEVFVCNKSNPSSAIMDCIFAHIVYLCTASAEPSSADSSKIDVSLHLRCIVNMAERYNSGVVDTAAPTGYNCPTSLLEIIVNCLV